ncbi:hypothetical protein AYO44_04655 [Planctomycetaceae bacterium SCGC AG-212-F19]|nr:hypothetical protein AYO44_04655 [Planctomycetaceae bacterium SCGC AG-212-F19]
MILELFGSILTSVLIVIMWMSIGFFLLKTAWNFAVPYAIIREAVYEPENRHGWSIFILFDLAFLLLGIIASALSGQQETLRPLNIAIIGVGCILASYIHMAVVLLLLGSWLNLFPKEHHDEHFQDR